MEFAGSSLLHLLSPFAVVLDQKETSLDLPLELPVLLLDLVPVSDFPMAIGQVVGGWLRILGVGVWRGCWATLE